MHLRNGASGRLLELLQDRRILQSRYILRDFLAFGDRAQQATHDLAGTGLGQVVAEADFVGLGDRSDFLRDPVAQFLRHFLGGVSLRTRTFQNHVRDHCLALDVVRLAHHRRFRDGRMRHQRALHLHGADAVARHVEHVVTRPRSQK